MASRCRRGTPLGWLGTHDSGAGCEVIGGRGGKLFHCFEVGWGGFAVNPQCCWECVVGEVCGCVRVSVFLLLGSEHGVRFLAWEGEFPRRCVGGDGGDAERDLRGSEVEG